MDSNFCALNPLKICFQKVSDGFYNGVKRATDLKNNEDFLIRVSQVLLAAMQLVHLYTGRVISSKTTDLLNAPQMIFSFGILRVPKAIYDFIEKDVPFYCNNKSVNNKDRLNFWVKTAEKLAFIVVDIGCFIIIPIEVLMQFESVAKSIGNIPVLGVLVSGIRVACIIGYAGSFVKALIICTVGDPAARTKSIMDMGRASSEIALNIMGLLAVAQPLLLVWTLVTKSIAIIDISIYYDSKKPEDSKVGV
jgi:hypothetical protein